LPVCRLADAGSRTRSGNASAYLAGDRRVSHGRRPCATGQYRHYRHANGYSAEDQLQNLAALVRLATPSPLHRPKPNCSLLPVPTAVGSGHAGSVQSRALYLTVPPALSPSYRTRSPHPSALRREMQFSPVDGLTVAGGGRRPSANGLEGTNDSCPVRTAEVSCWRMMKLHEPCSRRSGRRSRSAFLLAGSAAGIWPSPDRPPASST
jgi:hypothetical protein